MKRLLAMALVLVPREGDACSPPPPYFGRLHAPPDDAVGIATNARVIVQHRFGDGYGAPALIGDVIVRPAGGAAIPADVTVDARGRVVIRAAWEPATTYEVLDRIDETCDAYDIESCTLPEPAVFLTFTTGETADVTPPLFAGIEPIELLGRDTCDNDACCGPYDRFALTIPFAAAADESQVFYDVLRVRDGVETPLAVGLAGPTYAAVYCSAAKWAILGDLSLDEGDELRVRAEDLAGNREANTVTSVVPDVDCSQDVEDGPDGGPIVLDPDAGVAASSGDGGCTVGAGGPGGLAGLLLAAALWTFRRRRRI